MKTRSNNNGIEITQELIKDLINTMPNKPIIHNINSCNQDTCDIVDGNYAVGIITDDVAFDITTGDIIATVQLSTTFKDRVECDDCCVKREESSNGLIYCSCELY